MACLSSRVPYGENVSPEKLRMIEQAENLLRDLGFYDVRVRHHELNSSGSKPSLVNAPLSSAPAGHAKAPLLGPSLARIEVGPSEMLKFLVDGNSAKVVEALKKIGYLHVTLDLLGYRRGSLNGVA
jgi:uncharacterized protein